MDSIHFDEMPPLTPAETTLPSLNDSSESAAPSRLYRSFVVWLLLVVGTVQATVILNARPLQSANDRSRWCAVWSIVERRSFQIDEIRRVPGWDTIDMVKIDGHFYSTKPPILAIMAAAIYAPLRAMGWDLIGHTQFVSGITLLVLNLLPFLVGVYLFSRFLITATKDAITSGIMLTVLAWGTMATPFLATLNNHVPAFALALGLIWSLAAWLEAIQQPDDSPGTVTRWAGVTGFLAGWLVCFELPSAFLLVAIPLLRILSRVSSPKAGHIFKEAVFFGVGAAVPLLLFLICNFVATGELSPLYASYGTDRYRFVEEGVPSYWMEPQGVDRNVDAFPVYLFHCLLGHHGLFSQTPFLLLAIPAWLLAIQYLVVSPRDASGDGKTIIGKRLGLLCVATWIVVLGFYLTRTQNYNYGGVSVALRWALWLVPFGLASTLPIVAALKKRGWGVVLMLLLAGASITSAWLPAGNAWQQPWLFTWMAQRGWIDYRQATPPLAAPLMTWFASIPAGDASATWQSISPDGQRETLTLSTTGEVKTSGDVRYTRVDVRETSGPWSETSPNNRVRTSQRTLWIDAAGLASGKPPAQILTWFAPVTLEEQLDDLAFIRGLPLMRPYAPGYVRYLKTPLRRDAFRTQRVASEVVYPQEADDASAAKTNESRQPQLRYRMDLWLSEEVPFGTLQWERTLRDPVTGQVLGTQIWQMIDAHPAPQQESSLGKPAEEVVKNPK